MMTRKLEFCVLLVAGGFASPGYARDVADEPVRTWTEAGSDREVEARLLQVHDANGTIVVERIADGRKFTIPIQRFSESDRAYIRGLSARGAASAQPGAVASTAAADSVNDPNTSAGGDRRQRAGDGASSGRYPEADARVHDFTDANFASEVLRGTAPVLVDFTAPWCGPCRQMAPVVEAVAARYAGKVRVGKVNIDVSPSTSQQWGVSAIPMLILFRDGKPVDRLVGLAPGSRVEQMLDRVKD